jgi:hypothetical protein
MTSGLSKKVDLEKLAEKYLSRLNGKPDATRLLLNMLADDVTDITTLRNYVIRHEYNALSAKPNSDKAAVIERLSETYGLGSKEIQKILGI